MRKLPRVMDMMYVVLLLALFALCTPATAPAETLALSTSHLSSMPGDSTFGRCDAPYVRLVPRSSMVVKGVASSRSAAETQLGGTIDGRFFGPNGEPIEGVWLWIQGPGGVLYAASDATGKYSASGLAPGDYVVYAFGPFPYARCYLGYPSGPQVFHLDADLTSITYDQVLPFASSVSLEVEDEQGNPLADCLVRIAVKYPGGGDDLMGATLLERQTDTNGLASFADLAAGSWQVVAMDSSPLTRRAPKWATQVTPWRQIAVGESQSQRVTLPLGGSVAGRVTDEYGLPLAGSQVEVFIYDPKDSAWNYWCPLPGWRETFPRLPIGVTDSQGAFEISGIPPGPCIVGFSKEGYHRVLYKHGFPETHQIEADAWSEAVRVQVKSGEVANLMVTQPSLLASVDRGSIFNPFPSASGQNASRPAVILIGGLNEDYGFDGYQSRDSGWHDVYSYLSTRGYDVVVVPSQKNASSDNVVDSLGGYTGDNASRVQKFLEETNLGTRKVIVVGHSMGGLIARKWIGSPELWRDSGLTPVGLIQLGTPNDGAPAMLLAYAEGFTGKLDPNQSLVELDNTLGVPEVFNDQYPRPGVPVLKIGGDFFFDSSDAEIDAARFPMLRKGASTIVAGSFDRPNDGAVSVDSLQGLPVANKTLIYPVMHSDNLLCRDFESAGFVRPLRDTEDELRILKDVYTFCEDIRRARVKAPIAVAQSVSSGRLGPNTGAPTLIEQASVGGSSGSLAVLDETITLSALSTTTVPFSVEGTVAAIAVRCDDPALDYGVFRQDGSRVQGEAESEGHIRTFAFASVPGATYVLRLRSSATTEATVTVTDVSSSTLLVQVDPAGTGGAGVVATASLMRDGTRLPGQFVVASDGQAALMHDDGVSPDASNGDGRYSASLTLPSRGDVAVCQVDATATVGGVLVKRTGVALTQIVEPRALLDGTPMLSVSLTSSGKVSAFKTMVPLSVSEDCTLQATAKLVAGGSVIGRSTKTIVQSAGLKSVPILISAQDVEGLGDVASPIHAEVDLYDATDGGLVRLDNRTSNALSVSSDDLAVARATVTPLSTSVRQDPVVIEGASACNTETISGVELSLDDGTTWFAAPKPANGWGSNETTWSCAFILDEGEWEVRTRLRGQNGVIPAETHDLAFRVDRTPPKTTAEVTGDMTQSVRITFSAEDSSTVTSTRYSLDGSAWGVGNSLDCASPGVHALRFSSTDEAGNVETEKSVIFTVTTPVVFDTVAPVTTTDAKATYTSSATITLTSQDTGGSGLAGTYYRLDGSSALVGTAVTTSVLGTHTLIYWSVDKAGNIETAKSVSFAIVAPVVNPTPKPKVSLGAPVAPKTMKKNKYYTVYGSLKPKHVKGSKPVRVHKYKKVSGKWKSYGYVKATAYNYGTYTRFKVKMKLTSKGSWRLRAYAPADSKHEATWSSKHDYVTVK